MLINWLNSKMWCRVNLEIKWWFVLNPASECVEQRGGFYPTKEFGCREQVKCVYSIPVCVCVCVCLCNIIIVWLLCGCEGIASTHQANQTFPTDNNNMSHTSRTQRLPSWKAIMKIGDPSPPCARPNEYITKRSIVWGNGRVFFLRRSHTRKSSMNHPRTRTHTKTRAAQIQPCSAEMCFSDCRHRRDVIGMADRGISHGFHGD